MSSLAIEFFDKNTNQSKTIGIGPSKRLIAFLSGGAIYILDKKSESTITIPISEILNSEECDYVFPVDRTESYNEDVADENESSTNIKHSEVKNASKLQAIFFKLRNFYTKDLYGLNNSEEIPSLWKEENIKDTLWDYSYILDVISCLEVCKKITSEVKYSCDIS